MNLVKYPVLLLLLLCTSLTGFAQSSRPKYIPHDTTIAKMRKIDQRFNRAVMGMVLPDFSATLEDGGIINNASLRGKVSLLLLWYPGCANCMVPEMWDGFLKLAKERRDFQMISIVPDTADLAKYRSNHTLTIPIANVHSWSDCGKLNGIGGIPSCVLVNRDGTIARVSHFLNPYFFDEQAFADKINELLMF